MPKTTTWRELRERRPPNEQVVAQEKLKLRLAELREQIGATQTELAKVLGTSQPNVSQLERSADLSMSSLTRYVHALGGELKVVAVFGDAAYTLVDDVDKLAVQESALPKVIRARPRASGALTPAAKSAKSKSNPKLSGRPKG